MLLVIDNCEHLLEAAARIAARISAEVPGTRLLTTSRAPLNVRGEVVYRLTPLSLPDGKWTAGSLLASDAVRLFVDRAVLADPGFVLDESTAESVVEIVRSLDGLPLAIELAAARLRVMSAVALRARLGNVFSATGAGPRDLPERQRTLRNLVDWTFNRLDPEQAKLARFLAVFAGGFALDGVEAFAGRLAPDLVPDEELFRLVDDSIVTRSGPDRYHLHEIIRQYGVEQLEQTGELDEARDCHLDWASSLAGEIAEVDLEARCRARLEIDNLRTAFRWALDRGSHEAADRLAATLCTYLVFNGLVGEARSTGDAALAASNEPSAERVRLLQERAWVEWESHRPEALRHFCEEALALAAYSDPATINRLQLSLGSALTYETRFEEAENHLRGLLTSTSSGMQLAAILTGLSTNALHAGRVQDAITFARQAIDAREHPTPHMALGQALSRVDPARALDELRIAYSTWREWDDTVSIVQAECAAAWAAAASGATEAFDFISEGLTGVAQIGPEDFVECIDWLARALDAFGKQDSACRLVALVHELAERQSPLGRLRARLLESDLNIAPSESVSGNAIGILQEVHRALLADCDTVEPTAPGQSIW
jgi:predicted ATPase